MGFHHAVKQWLLCPAALIVFAYHADARELFCNIGVVSPKGCTSTEFCSTRKRTRGNSLVTYRGSSLAFIQPTVQSSSFSFRNVPTRKTSVSTLQLLNSKDNLADTVAAVSSLSGKDQKFEYEVLSQDPKVYLVRNFLSQEECQAYIHHASEVVSPQRMALSNPPAVSLDRSKLWPLPFLSLGAGIPPLVRLYEESSSQTEWVQIVNAVATPIGIALGLSTVLVLLVPELVRRFFSDSKARTSEAVALNQDEDVSLIRPLVDRAALVTDHAVSWQTLEAPVVTRYDPGALFALHNDASPTPSEWSDLGGQRVCTIITYLNDCATGGGTRFSRLMGDITVQPKQGTALVFFPAFSDSLEADERTIHESLPAVETKWIVQLFGRVGPRVPPPLGIPDSYDKR